MKKSSIVNFVKLLSVFLFIETALIGCVSAEKQRVVADVPEDIPIPEFIIGYWRSTSVSRGDEEATEDSVYEVEFVDSDTLKYMVNSEGYTMQYSFVDSSEIYVDNKRILGGEKWRLERDGQTLIVHRTIGDMTIHIIFDRRQGRLGN